MRFIEKGAKYAQNNIIKITRGDTFVTELMLSDSDSETGFYEFTPLDVVYIGVTYPHQNFEDAVIKKRYDYDDISTYVNNLLEYQDIDPEDIPKNKLPICFTSQDTLNLPCGVYFYSIKLRKNANQVDEQVITVINKTKFIIED